MKQCRKCGATAQDTDVFCTACGERLPDEILAEEKPVSKFLKYSSYVDNEALFRVAVAKETGIVKEEYPGETEDILKEIAMRGHLDGMFRYANLLLKKQPPQKQLARKWLSIGAENGHVPSKNLLKVFDWEVMPPEERPFADLAGGGDIVIPPSVDNLPTDGAVPPPKAPARTGEKLSGEEIFDRMANVTVEIFVQNKNEAASASGFFVSSTGFVLTNAHAILDGNKEPYSTIAVRFHGKLLRAYPVAFGSPSDGKHDSVDLALLFVPDASGEQAVTFGSSASCRNGQKVYLIGNSLGDGTCITSGIISDVKHPAPGLSYPYLMTDAAANPGNSGGPLLNEWGELIGVLVAGISTAEGMNFTIPVDVAKQFLIYIAEEAKIPKNATRELAAVVDAPKNMAAGVMTVLSGVKLVVDIVSMIANFFSNLKK